MSAQPTTGVIIAAAGSSERLAGDRPKQWRPLAGMTLVERALRSFQTEPVDGVAHLVLVVAAGWEERARATLREPRVSVHVVTGGATRSESVRNGLEAMPPDIDVVAVHDAARPFWPVARWTALVASLRDADGAVLAVPVPDTLKDDRAAGCRTIDRKGLWLAQTPQAFVAASVRAAHDRAKRESYCGTDDAELVERNGGRIALVESDSTNFKITTNEDWRLAEQIVSNTPVSATRVGIGFDAHRLGGEGPLVLGGVRFSESGGLIGHSDGDALLHAICDALLGAAALGDIGHHFPPSDPHFSGVDSRELVRATTELLGRAGYAPCQVDCVVMAEVPRLAPQINTMRAIIAADLGLALSAVSVKATTTESMGFVGRREGIAAQAIATIRAIQP